MKASHLKKTFWGLLAFVVLFPLFLASLIWFYPHVLMKTPLPNYLQQELGPELEWKTLELTGGGALLTRSFQVDLTGVAVRYPSVTADVERASVIVQVKILSLQWWVKNLSLSSQQLKITSADESATEPVKDASKEKATSPFEVLDQVRYWIGKIRAARLNIESFLISSGDYLLSSSVNSDLSAGKFSLNLQGDLKEGKDTYPISLRVSDERESKEENGKIELALKVEKRPKPILLNASLFPDQSPKPFKLNWSGTPYQTEGEISGTITDGKLSMSPSITAKPSDVGKLVLGPECQVDFSWVDEDKLSLDCRFRFDGDMGVTKMDPQGVAGKIDVKLVRGSDSLSGEVSAGFDSISHSLYDGKGSGWFKFSAGVEDPSGSFKIIENQVDVNVKIREFQDIVQFLRPSPFPVPRPFSVLKGTVSFVASGAVATDGQGLSLPLNLETDLRSKQQQVKVSASGTFIRKPNGVFHAEAEVKSHALELVAPPVGIMDRQPSFVVDDRFKEKSQVQAEEKEAKKVAKKAKASGKAEPESFTYQLHVVSVKPAKIHWEAVQTPVPIDFDLNINQKGMDGEVVVGSTSVNLFGRTATLQKLKLTPYDKAGVWGLEGRVFSEHGPYRLYLDLRGTSERPQISFTSEPPLSTDQIMAIFVFGRPTDNLDPSESESVGNFRSAVAEGALNLFSLFALSSTPIRSIGYEPTTGTVRAEVAVGAGSSLVFGSNMSSRHKIGIQKRLGSHWWINSYLQTEGGFGDRDVSTFLEWLNHY